MSADAALSRRTLLKAGAAAGGGLLIGFHVGEAAAQPAPFAPNAFVRIDRDGRVTLTMPNQEMGQGIYTAHSQIIAEELDVAFDQVAVVPAPPDDTLYGGPRKRQGTGGSSSVRGGLYPVLRQAGADGRALLVAAAAAGWGVPVAGLRTAQGRVFDDARQRSIGYGDLVDRAGRLPALTAPAPLKDPATFTIIGRPKRRLDTPSKVNGSAQYAIDVMPGRCKVATITQAPVVGATLKSVDQQAALAVPGVRQVVVLPDLVAIVGDHMWAAISGMRACNVVWNDGPHGDINSAQIWRELRQASTLKGANALTVGDPARALAASKPIEAAYEMPFLAHAPMEPLNCTVDVRPGSCEVWVGTQVQPKARDAAAKAAGLTPEQVTLHNFMLGGAFGRRLDVDMVTNAVRIGQQVAGPVKVVWTREEDIRHDMLRPVYRNVMAATLRDGLIDGWSHKIAAASVNQRMSGKPPAEGLDKGSVDGAIDLPFAIPHQTVDYVQAEPRAVNVGYWRGVGPNNSVFAIQSFLDECAKAAGSDPVDFRLAMLRNSKAEGAGRLAQVIRTAAARANWSGALGARTGRGIAAHNVFGSYLATVAEVEVDEAGDVRVHRFVTVIDAGTVINPNTVVAQIEGGLIFGLSAALFGDVQIERGRIVPSNFHDYRVMRIHETPAIEVHVLRSQEDPGGVGEPGTTTVAPSVANAIAAATGIRLRRMPVDRDVLGGRKPA